MAESRVEMPTWGWGSPERDRSLPPVALEELEERFGPLAEPERPAALADFEIPASAMPEDARREVFSRVDGKLLSDAPDQRILRAAGKSYPDLIRMRAGRPGRLPDLVFRPADDAAIGSLLEACSTTGTAVVPFGGGTSVVGGVSPEGLGGGVVALDLARLSGVTHLDPDDRIAIVRAGTLAPEAEAEFGSHGLTLGHFPQSFLHASIGGFVATRSSGQASTGYGRIDANVLGLTMVAPGETVDLPPRPGTAAGPDFRQLIVGSEGTLGVITEVALQLAGAPSVTCDRAWIVEGFDHGRDLLRQMEQSGCAPTVARLSDEDETRISLSLSATDLRRRLFARYALSKGRGTACLLITGFEGSRSHVESRLAEASAILRSGGAASLGSVPGRAWRHGRFDGPYLRDSLMDRGLLVDTLETAAPWSRLEDLHRGIRSALRESLAQAGGDPIVMCHVSHLYRGGASLYFTFVGAQPSSDPDARIERWWGVKAAASDAIVRLGGTITHHHAIGTDHRPWMEQELGTPALAALRAAKGELDPAGIMNPGKLFPG